MGIFCKAFFLFQTERAGQEKATPGIGGKKFTGPVRASLKKGTEGCNQSQHSDTAYSTYCWPLGHLS